jgi:hypothetical protein
MLIAGFFTACNGDKTLKVIINNSGYADRLIVKNMSEHRTYNINSTSSSTDVAYTEVYPVTLIVHKTGIYAGSCESEIPRDATEVTITVGYQCNFEYK